MRLAAAALICCSATTAARAGELRGPYFAATTPGSWTRYQMVAEGVGKSLYTYTRLPDRDGRSELEIRVEYTEGVGAGTSSTSRYVLARNHPPDRDALSYLHWIEAYAFVAEDGTATPLPADTVKAIREGAMSYAGGFTFKAATEVAGRRCDSYAYRATSGGPRPSVDEGEICLDPGLPFGIVRQSGRVKDSSGALQSTYTLLFVATGSGGDAEHLEVEATPPRPAAGPSGPLLLVAAYQNEQIKLWIEVPSETGGKQLAVTIENRTDQPLEVLLRRGPITIDAGGVPLETLTLVSERELRVAVPGGGKAERLLLAQSGKRGAIEGKFKLSVHEGTALFQGSMTSGSLR